MKKIASVLVMLISIGVSYSQISVGGQFSYLNAFGFGGGPGFGAKIDYANSDKLVYTGGVNYYLPITLEESTYANAFSSATNPGSISVNSEEKATFIQFHAGVKYYFSGDYESDFGFYCFAGAGVWLIPWTSTVTEEYNQLLYYGPEDRAETLTGLTIDFGLGIEKGFDFGYLFAEGGLNLKAKSVNGSTIDQPIPNFAALNLGFRYPF
tara:strand:- start:131 stop:757 length:627 start_codon:yes stop_codon:yes gene_type:complete